MKKVQDESQHLTIVSLARIAGLATGPCNQLLNLAIRNFISMFDFDERDYILLACIFRDGVVNCIARTETIKILVD